ncbi:hypothetical protein DOTSEDRAFT_96453, partial [Dothistroma septosporum NZE10]
PANTNFNFSNMDWQGYKNYRPRRPPALFEIIYQYHDRQGGAWDCAVDIGVGPGVVTEELLRRFKHVVLSDPSPHYIATAKTLFGA